MAKRKSKAVKAKEPEPVPMSEFLQGRCRRCGSTKYEVLGFTTKTKTHERRICDCGQVRVDLVKEA